MTMTVKKFFDGVLFSALCTRCYQLAAKYFREGGWELTDRCRCPAPPVLPLDAELARHLAPGSAVLLCA